MDVNNQVLNRQRLNNQGLQLGGGTTNPEGTGGETPDPSNPGGGTTEPGGSGETPDPSTPGGTGGETPVPEFVVEDDKIIFNSLLGIYPDNISERAIVIGYKDEKSNEEINFPYTVDKFTPITEGRYTATELGLKPIEIITSTNRTILDPSVKEAWFGKKATLGKTYETINKTLEKAKFVDTVVHIEAWALGQCASLISVVLPEGVESIGDYAFCRCSSLPKLELPSTVKELGTSAFSNCISLKEINIPSSIITLNSAVFVGCSMLESIELPEGIETIPHFFFEGCSNLKSFTIPSTVKTIGDSAFHGCYKLTNLIIPETVTTILDSAFRDCRFTSIELPSKITNIPKHAFLDCCYLESITIPKSVSNIGLGAFKDCSRLRNIKYGSTKENWDKITKDSTWDKGTPTDKVITYQE